jgi:hypothetical protein
VAVAYDAVSTGTPVATTSPITWSHTSNGNGIIIATNWDNGATDLVTAVSYGGVALAKLGSQLPTGSSNGGLTYWGKIGGLPTGANTASVTHSASSLGKYCPGAISFSGAGSFAAAQTTGVLATTVSLNVTGTTSGGLIIAATSFGGLTSGTITATSPGTSRWSLTGDTAGGADNTGAQTCASPGGTQAIGFGTSAGLSADSWALVAVEVLPAAAVKGSRSYVAGQAVSRASLW